MLGAKLWEKTGVGRLTVRSSVAVPLLPCEEVRSPVSSVCVATVLEVTGRVTTQLWLAPRRPSLRLRLLPPEAAVKVPLQVLDWLPAATVTPLGNVAPKARSLAGLPETSVMVRVRVLLLPLVIVSGENSAEKLGADCA